MGVNINKYRFTIDNIVCLDDPKDWDNTSIITERDPVLKGLFIQYVSRLTFISNGYEYLLQQADENNYCGEVDFLLEEVDNDGYNIVGGLKFEGIIKLADVKFNRTQQTAEVEIQDRNKASLLIRFKDISVVVNQRSLTLNGEPLAGIGSAIDFPAPVSTSKTGYYLYDVLQYIVSYISDNTITVQSDWFQNRNLRQSVIYLNIDNFLVGGEDVTLSLTNIWGETISSSVSGPTAIGLPVFNDLFFDLTYLDPILYDNQGRGHDLEYMFGIIPATTGTPTVDVTINNWHNPVMNISGTTPGAITETQIMDQFTDGAANVFMITGGELNGNGVELALSLADFFKEFNILYNLELRFDANSNILYVEPQPDFFVNTSTIRLTDVNEVEEEFADEIIYRTFNFDNGSSDEPQMMQAKSSYTFNSCGKRDFGGKLKYYYGWNAFENFSELKSKDVLVAETEPGTNNLAVYDHRFFSPFFTTFMSEPLISGTAIHHLVVQRHLGLTNIAATRAGKSLTVEDTKKIKRLNKFNYPLTWDEHRQVAGAATDYILFDNDQIGVRKGWIKIMKYSLKTGSTQFELYSS